MRYLSVCSGIEAATVAWAPLGWTAAGFAEIEAFPSRVLAHHYGSNLPGAPPAQNGVPNFGDFTGVPLDALGPVDVLVGGTPCQAFSVAGKRLSLADARGNLSLAYTVLAHDLARSHGLRWAVWENVPGVLSTDDNAFGCFLSGLVGGDDPLRLPHGIDRWPDAGLVAGPRARAAWRICDAQYFGLAQRRRRVFVVAGFGDGADPAAVLLERAGVRRHPPARGEAGKGVAGTLAAGSPDGSGYRNDADTADNLIAYGGNDTRGPIDLATAINAHGGPHGRQDFESETFVVTPPLTRNPYGDHESRDGLLVTHSLRAGGFDASEDGTGRGTPIVPISFDCKAGGDTSFAIGDVAGALRGAGHGGGHAAVASAWAVRRLMPVECERLQGFPDGYTAISGAADGPRYRALGNSMAVPVMAWIGARIAAA